jgi:protein SCO1/2
MMRGVIALVAAFVIGTSMAAAAGERLSGTVLMTPSGSEAVVHHTAFDGMPAMTMTFRIPAQSRLAPGDRISAVVDRSTDPWSLTDIRVLASVSGTPTVTEPPIARVGDRVPATRFLDQRGRSLSLQELHGAPFAISFIYTRCTDGKMCPLVSAKFRTVQEHLTAPAALVEVSLDPAYDRPEILSRYAAAYGADPARWHLLTGDPRAVLDFAAHFGILEQAAGPVKIVHSERLAIVNGDGRIVRFFDDVRWSPADVLRALGAASAGQHQKEHRYTAFEAITYRALANMLALFRGDGTARQTPIVH